MRLALVAVGRLKAGPERELVERYSVRIAGIHRSLGFPAFDTVEIEESRARSAAERRRQEAAPVLARTANATLVAFDERGSNLSSPDLAAHLRTWRDAGRSGAAFALGGPDGFDAAVRARADLTLSFGQMTLPHQLVRVLVAEQIYRALTILAGHPYHRGESGTA